MKKNRILPNPPKIRSFSGSSCFAKEKTPRSLKSPRFPVFIHFPHWLPSGSPAPGPAARRFSWPTHRRRRCRRRSAGPPDSSPAGPPLQRPGLLETGTPALERFWTALKWLRITQKWSLNGPNGKMIYKWVLFMMICWWYGDCIGHILIYLFIIGVQGMFIEFV